VRCARIAQPVCVAPRLERQLLHLVLRLVESFELALRLVEVLLHLLAAVENRTVVVRAEHVLMKRTCDPTARQKREGAKMLSEHENAVEQPALLCCALCARLSDPGIAGIASRVDCTHAPALALDRSV